MTSKLGIFPEEENTLTIGSSGIAAGETDLIVVELSGRKMPSGVELGQTDSDGTATLEVARSDESGRVLGASWRYGGDGYGLLGAAPLLDTFVVDGDGYDAFLAGEAVEAVLVDGGEVSVDPSRYWYVVVHNSWSSVTAAVGTLSTTLSPGKDATFDDEAAAELRYRLLPGEHVALELAP
ncbi:MAG: hypothetical protein GY884_34585 [Proteobacteria bacterium]|nr:hypothetical protein [Pseudomonadota bacterium]